VQQQAKMDGADEPGDQRIGNMMRRAGKVQLPALSFDPGAGLVEVRHRRCP
jgi:hypothetical protein